MPKVFLAKYKREVATRERRADCVQSTRLEGTGKHLGEAGENGHTFGTQVTDIRPTFVQRKLP